MINGNPREVLERGGDEEVVITSSDYGRIGVETGDYGVAKEGGLSHCCRDDSGNGTFGGVDRLQVIEQVVRDQARGDMAPSECNECMTIDSSEYQAAYRPVLLP